MNENWNHVKRNDFGWYVEGEIEIKAFWLPEVEFANQESDVSGKIAESTLKTLRLRILEYSSELALHSNLTSAFRADALIAFKISDDLGGGFMIVLPNGLIDFKTIAVLNKARMDLDEFDEQKGVKGWLSFFIIFHLYLYPLFSLASIVIIINEDFKLYPDFEIYSYVRYIIGLIIMIIGIRAAIALKRIKPNAVKITKQFLVIRLCFVIIFLIPPLLIEIPYELEKNMYSNLTADLVQSVVWFFVWIKYFKVSKRVKATYSIS
ncbi:MAG: DUF2569 family protein [Ignavibacteria bacterium]|nr:DUF2569 family protein [Ignavibacteria bacterium]